MTFAEARELKSFVTNLTAKTSEGWCVDDLRGINSEFIVRVDPIWCAAHKLPLRGDEVFRIARDASLDEAKRLVIERLAARARS